MSFVSNGWHYLYTQANIKGSHVIQYATNSVGLAKDVAAPLLRLGIVARIKQVQQANISRYHVKIMGIDAQNFFR